MLTTAKVEKFIKMASYEKIHPNAIVNSIHNTFETWTANVIHPHTGRISQATVFELDDGDVEVQLTFTERFVFEGTTLDNVME